MNKRVERRSSIRGIENYKPGGIVEEGDWMYRVANARRSQDDHGSYVYALDLVPLPEAEEKLLRLRERYKDARASANSDQPHSRAQAEFEALDDELRVAEGRPTQAQERAAAAIAKEAKRGEARADALAEMETPRDQVVLDGDGDPGWGRSYYPIMGYLRNYMGVNTSHDGITRLDDDEIHSLLRGEASPVLLEKLSAVQRAYNDPSDAVRAAAKDQVGGHTWAYPARRTSPPPVG